MKTLIVIPARYNSTRFPGKPLVDMAGKTMIQRVYEQCLKSNADRVIVSTDTAQIFDQVVKFGGTCAMTRECESGTERVIDTALNLNEKYDIIVNVQGDEPFIDPEDINLVISMVKSKPKKVATLVTSLKDKDRTDRNVVKCVHDYDKAIMFTRSAIYSKKSSNINKHIGIYGFSYNTLETISKLEDRSYNEIAENLEQLRWMDSGLKIRVAYTPNESIGIDTKKDLRKALERLEHVEN